MTVAQALQQAWSLGLARIDAQVLLLHVMGQASHARAWLLTHDRHTLSDAQQAAFEQALLRRLRGEPVAYLTGEKEFFGLRLHHLIERSQLHVFGACGHWTQIEHAAAFNRLVASFLAD